MLRNPALLLVTSLSTVALAALSTRAEDDKEAKPLVKIMKKIDAHTKAVRAATATAAKFKDAGKGKSLIPHGEDLIKLAKETRGFKEPAESQKKPYEKWTDLSDRLIDAAETLNKAATKGDLIGTRRAWSAINNTCTNCHGAFRPSTSDGF